MSKLVGHDRVIPVIETLADERLPPVDLEEAPPNDAATAPRYVERQPIGRGGLGEVIEAFDLDLRRTVALKRLRTDRDGPEEVARLIAEAQITAQLEHPNIPPVHGVGVDDTGRPFFTMTRIRGDALGDLIRRAHAGPTPWEEVGLAQMLRIFLRVAYALAAAHARGVIHRDLKPDNIMVGAFGEVRLMDWGIAKVLGTEEPDTRDESTPPPIELSGPRPESIAGSVIGTPGYMSPEQVVGRRDLDVRADIYALGATLYEMLAGRAPVTAETNADKLRHTVDGTIVPLDEFPWVPAPLCAIVHKAMATQRDDRYGSAVDVIADVEDFLEGRPVGAHEEGWLTRLGRYYTSRPPRSMRLRFVDIDTLAASSLLIGAAIGAWTARWLNGWEWLVAVVAVLVGLPFYRTWFRRPRHDDPSSNLLRSDPLTPGTKRERPVHSATTRREGPATRSDAHATTVDQASRPESS